MSEKTVLLNCENNIATITFNRPQAMNAFDYELAIELDKITNEVLHNDQIRAVCLRGAGKLFMAGGDIRFFYEHLDEMPQAVMKIMRLLNSSIHNLRMMNKPTLAVVHGSVAGVGVSLMLACDLVLAAEETKFTTAYNKIGLSPDGGASYFLPRLVGAKKALELFYFADLFTSKEAHELGLVNWVVPAEQLEKKAHETLTKLAKGPTRAYAATRQLVHSSVENDLAKQLEREVAYFIDSTKTQDFRNGVSAFVNKTSANFEGK